MAQASDRALLERWTAHRDAEAFSELARRHSAMVFATCRRILGDTGAAEDVSQECFMGLSQADPGVGAYLGAWLHRVATNRSRDFLRSAGRRRAREHAYASSRKQSTELQWNDIEALVDEAIAELPDKLRQPVVCHFLEGETHQAIADRLGVSRRVVTYRIGRGVEAVRALLGKRGVKLGAAALSGLLAANAAEAAPAALMATLGKAALTGPVECSGTPLASPATSGKVIGGIMAAKAKTWTVVVIVGLLILGTVALLRNPSSQGGGAAAQQEAQLDASSGAEAAASRANLTGGDGRATILSQTARQESAADGGNRERLAGAMSGAIRARQGAPRRSSEDSAEETEPVLASISGYVADSDGYALPGAWVAVADQPSTATAVDDSGMYVIRNVELAGAVTVNAGADGFVTGSKNVSPPDGHTAEGVNFHLSSGVTLVGRLLNTDGAPVSGARIEVMSFTADFNWAMSSPIGALTDARGLFTIGFPNEGTAALTCRGGGARRATFSGVRVGGTEVVELRIGRTASLSGAITWSDNTPATGLRVVPFTRTAGHTSNLPARETDTEGRYAIAGLDPGVESYLVVVMDRSGQALCPRETLGPLAAGESRIWNRALPATMEVTGAVTGEQSGRPLERVRVKCVLDGQYSGETWTAAHGSYRYTVFQAGDCVLYPEVSGMTEAELIEHYGKKIPWNGENSPVVDFVVPDRGSVILHVADSAGVPIQGAEVWLHKRLPNGGSSMCSWHNYTDANGDFAWPECDPGVEHWCTVRKDGYVSAKGERIAVDAIEVRFQEVILYRTAGVEGRLIGPDGAVIGDAPMEIRMAGSAVKLKTDSSGSFTVSAGMPATEGALEIMARTVDGTVLTSVPLQVECVESMVVGIGDVAMVPQQVEVE